MSFAATHLVPEGGLSTWPSPDRSTPPGPPLEAGLGVQVVERQETMARVACSNGWEAWVEEAHLRPVGGPSAAAGGRPRWLWPVIAVVAASVALLVGAVVVLRGGDEAGQLDVASTVPTAAGGLSATSSTRDAQAVGQFVLPDGVLLGDDWTLSEKCSSSGTPGPDCAQGVTDEVICGRETLDAPVAKEHAFRRAQTKSEVTLLTHVRVYETDSEAQAAMDRVKSAFAGPCKESAEPAVTIVHSPLAVKRVGDDQLAIVRMFLEEGKPNRSVKHFYLRKARVLIGLELRDRDGEPPDGFMDRVMVNLVNRSSVIT